MRIDRASRQISAPPMRLYQALTDREAVQAWLPPEGARGTIDAFEPWPGGAFRITLAFDSAGADGTRKSSDTTDVVEGHFVDLIPGQLVRQRFTFQSDDPAFAGEMTMTWTFKAAPGGTEVQVTAENVPAGIRPQDHQVGMSSSLANLARYVA